MINDNKCSVAAREADIQFVLQLDDGAEANVFAATAQDALDDARERGYKVAEISVMVT